MEKDLPKCIPDHATIKGAARTTTENRTDTLNMNYATLLILPNFFFFLEGGGNNPYLTTNDEELILLVEVIIPMSMPSVITFAVTPSWG